MIVRAESWVMVSSTWLAKNMIGGFDDREQQRKKYRRDQREFDRGRSRAAAAKSAQDIVERRLWKLRATASGNPCSGGNELRARITSK